MKKLLLAVAMLILAFLLLSCVSEAETDVTQSDTVTDKVVESESETENLSNTDLPEKYEFSLDDPEVDNAIFRSLLDLIVATDDDFSFNEGDVVPADSLVIYFEIHEIGPIDAFIGEEYEQYKTSDTSIRLPKEIFKSVMEKRFAVTVDLEGSSRLTEDGEYMDLSRQVRGGALETPVVREISEEDGVINVVCDAIFPHYTDSFDNADYYTYEYSFIASLRFNGEDYTYLSYKILLN